MDIMLQEVVNDIRYFYELYVTFAFRLGVLTFLLSLTVGVFYVYWRRGRKLLLFQIFLKSVILAILSAYTYIVIGITMLSRSEGYSDIVNLELFSTFHDDFVSRKYIYENLILLVPYAILLYLLAYAFRRAAVSFLTGVLTSLLIEYVQMVTHLGRFEVDDIMTNAAGYLAGYVFCCVIHDMILLIRDLCVVLKGIFKIRKIADRKHAEV